MESLEVRGRHETHTTETNRVSSGNICEFQKLVCVLSLPPLSSRFLSSKKSSCHLLPATWVPYFGLIL